MDNTQPTSPEPKYSADIRSLAYAMESMAFHERCQALYELAQSQHMIGFKNGKWAMSKRKPVTSPNREELADLLWSVAQDYNDRWSGTSLDEFKEQFLGSADTEDLYAVVDKVLAREAGIRAEAEKSVYNNAYMEGYNQGHADSEAIQDGLEKAERSVNEVKQSPKQ